jgi:hypothetical protein
MKDIPVMVAELKEAEMYLSAAELSEEHARERVVERRALVREAQQALVEAVLENWRS